MNYPIINGHPHVIAADAAREAGTTRDYIAKLARRGHIRGCKIGGTWLIDRDDLRHFLETHTKSRGVSAALP